MEEQLLSGMMLTVSGRKFILPISIIKRSFKTTAESITVDPDGDSMIEVNDGIKVLLRLSDYLDMPASELPMEEQIVMQLDDGTRELGVFVDTLLGECRAEVVPMPPFCGNGAHISGCILQESGELFLVVNHEGLFEGVEPYETEEKPEPPPLPEVKAESGEQDGHETDDIYLSFELGKEVYALPIVYVREIIQMCEIISVPKASYAVEGIINRRGDILPVLNLFKLFTGASAGDVQSSSVIIMEHGDSAVGILIDSIRETIKLTEGDIKPLPQNKSDESHSYVSRLGRHEGDVILILDWSKVIEAM
jgi:purine-binding chemotaxis protein CheW